MYRTAVECERQKASVCLTAPRQINMSLTVVLHQAKHTGIHDQPCQLYSHIPGLRFSLFLLHSVDCCISSHFLFAFASIIILCGLCHHLGVIIYSVCAIILA